MFYVDGVGDIDKNRLLFEKRRDELKAGAC